VKSSPCGRRAPRPVPEKPCHPAGRAAVLGLALSFSLLCVCTPAPGGPDPWRLGESLFRSGRYREAAQAFHQVVLRDPSHRLGWLWYGAALVLAGRPRDALEPLRRAAAAQAEPYAWLWTGLAYEELGQEAQARSSYRQVLRRGAGTEAAYWAVRRLRGLQAAEAAESLALHPESYARLALRHNPALSPGDARRIGQALLSFARRFDVDPRLVSALVLVESGFNPRAVSPAGALGLGQLMPEVARGLGIRDPFSIEENLYGTVRVLRGHLDRFGYHRVPLALAAYNAGSGAVRRYGGIPPYTETRWYVYRVSQLYLRFLGL
jgi:soluble lytic murein transglycosylase-like protein